MKTITTVFLIIMLFTNCTNGNSQGKLLSSDYRIFKNTPVWQLAEAVKDEDTISITSIIKGNRKFVDYVDPIYGNTLLMLAVYNRNYNSVKKLLELGADPNKQALNDRESALMMAAERSLEEGINPSEDVRYLKVLLKYGGNPNAIQEGDLAKKGSRHYSTPLIYACFSGIFEHVKVLVEAGGDINFTSKYGTTPLFASLVGRNPDIVLYLLNKGANYNAVMQTSIDGKKIYILEYLNEPWWQFEPNSEKYKKVQEIKDFLKAHGVK